MLPKSIKLLYPMDIPRNPSMPLPLQVAIRGCNQVVSSIEKDGTIKQLTLRTEYDGLYDLELRIVDVQNGKGTVEKVTFKEQV